MSSNNEPPDWRQSVDAERPLPRRLSLNPARPSLPPDASAPPRVVRFSTEVERPTSGRAPGLTIDTVTVAAARGPSVEIQASLPDDTITEMSPNPARSPISPVSPRKRNRGYSLRRQLFFRNQQDQLEEDEEVPPQSVVTTDVGRPRSPAAVVRSSSNDVEMNRLSKSPSPEWVRTKGTEGDDIEVDHGHPKRKRNSLSIMMGSTVWSRASKPAKEHYNTIRKIILRAQEIPPSKEGRKIPINIERYQRGEQLIDERTGNHYVNNTIRSSRYTIWNFLPKQLFAQFSKLANFYFMCVSILQMIPTLSTTGQYTTIVPLLFFISLSMFKEGYDDYRRYKLDKKENRSDAKVFRPTGEVIDDEDEDESRKHWEITKWKDIKVGDIVELERDDWVPADLLILHSEGEHGIAYIETMALDGETNLKSKQALPIISERCDTVAKLATCRAEVVVEDPNLDLYNFEGKVVVEGDTKPLTNSQIVYRGSVLRNTPSMIGMVIFTGEESKIRMNANKNPRTKAPALQGLVNKIVLLIVVFVLALSIGCSVSYQFWRDRTEYQSWYLEDSSVPFFPIFASYVIMFNTLIPLSLYVSLEIVKLAQMYLLSDVDMYHVETDTPFEAHTSTINEDCGQVSYIFSDKTGTLTDNSMLFRKMSVGGQAWLHDLDIQRQADAEAGRIKLKHKKRKGKNKTSKTPKKQYSVKIPQSEQTGGSRKSMGDLASPHTPRGLKKMSFDGVLNRQSSSGSLRWKSGANPSRPQPQLSTVDLLEYLQTHPHTFFARKARFFLLAIALCHTCLPEEEDGSINYQAASPDETALVTAAMELGYIAINRQINTISVKTFPNGLDGEPMVESYEILDIIEFSSKRKRMSIIIKFPSGKICIFSKGADSTMIELLHLRELAVEKAQEVERRATYRKSLEAQEIIRRNSMHRTSIGGRNSISGRSSIGGPSRPSMNLNRLQPIRDEFEEWLKDKEDNVDVSSIDDESLYSRPSGQFANRHSIAFGEAPSSPLERDTSDDIVDENLAIDDAKVFERCFAHVNHFATEGLRTLLYAHRFIEDHEYTTWKNIYAEATTSLVDRQALIERAAELVERDFELTGATAIEDKLQKGVPEAIDKLRRAGIKLWMLTGDKRETAINIGNSCRLIKDYSTVTILDKEDVGLGKKIKSAIFDINAGKVAHSVVVVDGGTLATIDDDEKLKSLFFDLTILADSVVCCRASPSQKASLVKTIRTKVQKSVTLAIGDGANDIAMIQEAHVGVGITGKEGLQAARVSDYSMAQFRFLLKFLLVHGRWNYIRTCKYTVATFWKELLFYLTQALFQRWNGFTGSSLYEPWSLSMFNTLFTSLPVIFLGVFEKDLAAATLLAVPELYQKGQKNGGFNVKIYIGWMFVGTCQAMIAYFMMYTLYTPMFTVDQAVYAMGVLSYSICITVISSKLQIIEMHNKSVLAGVSFVCSVGGWFLWNIILSCTYNNNTIHNVKWSFLNHFGRDLSWWLVFIFAVAACLIFDVMLITLRTTFWPSDVDTFQEVEQHRDLRKRLEEAASDELQQGWQRGEKRPNAGGLNLNRGEKAEVRQLEQAGNADSSGNNEADDVEAMVARRFGSVRQV